MNLIRTFQIAAAALLFVSIYLAFTDPRSDYLFASIILMICSAFLAYRFHLKERISNGGNPSGTEGAPPHLDAEADEDNG
ncbi:MAG: hypothetical protein ACJ73D_11575 [Pyrinomonadaceae bacterium]